MDDRLGVPVREVVLATEPADLFVETEEGGAFVNGAEPFGDFPAGAVRDTGEQIPVGLFGEELRHRRLRTRSMLVLQHTVPEGSAVGNHPGVAHRLTACLT